MKRTCVVTGLALLMVVLSGVPAWAIQMSDKERMAHGVTLYESQKYEEAVQAFQEVDASKLSYWDQQKLPEMLRRSQEGLTRQAHAKVLMAEGEQAYKDGRWGTALTKFRQSQQADHLGAAGERRIDSLVKVAQETEGKHRDEVMKLLQQARLAEAANQTDKAIAGYRSVLAADVLLSDADRTYAERHLASLTGRPMVVSAPAVVAPATQVAPVVSAQVEPMDPVVTPAAPVEIEAAPVVVEPVEAPVDTPVEAAAPAETPVEVTTTPAPVEIPAEVVTVQVTPVEPEVAPVQPTQQAPATDWEEIRRQREAALATQGPEGRTLLEQYGSDLDVERQRVIAQVREQVLQAQAIERGARTPRELNDALARLDNAQRLVDSFPYFTPQGREDLTEEILLSRQSVSRQREEMIAEAERIRRREIEQQTADRVRSIEEQRQQRILSLWQSARNYAEVNEYARAAGVLSELLRLDPDNERARREQDRYAFWAEQKVQLQIRTDRMVYNKEALKEVEASAIPLDGIVYPANWEQLTESRRI